MHSHQIECVDGTFTPSNEVWIQVLKENNLEVKF